MLSRILKTSEDFSKKVAVFNHSMNAKLEALRNKITKAHQIADGVSLYSYEINYILSMQYLDSFRFEYRYQVKKTVLTMRVFVRISLSSWSLVQELQLYCLML